MNPIPVSWAFRAALRGALPQQAVHSYTRQGLFHSKELLNLAGVCAGRARSISGAAVGSNGSPQPRSLPWKTFAAILLLGLPASKLTLDILPLNDIDSREYLPHWAASQLNDSMGNTAVERRVTSAEVASEGTGRLVRDVATALAIIKDYKGADPSPGADWSEVHQRAAERLLKLCQVRPKSACLPCTLASSYGHFAGQ